MKFNSKSLTLVQLVQIVFGPSELCKLVYILQIVFGMKKHRVFIVKFGFVSRERLQKFVVQHRATRASRTHLDSHIMPPYEC